MKEESEKERDVIVNLTVGVEEFFDQFKKKANPYKGRVPEFVEDNITVGAHCLKIELHIDDDCMREILRKEGIVDIGQNFGLVMKDERGKLMIRHLPFHETSAVNFAHERVAVTEVEQAIATIIVTAMNQHGWESELFHAYYRIFMSIIYKHQMTGAMDVLD